MSVIRLITRNARRSPVRTVMTVSAVAIVLVAFALLRALSAGWSARIEQTPNNRVIVRHRLVRANALPVRYSDLIRQLPGVELAWGSSWVGFKLPEDDSVFFQSYAVDAADFVKMHYELSAPGDQKAAFINDRRGALASAELAAERGWHVGDVLHFKGRDTPGDWELHLSAIVKSTRVGFGERAVWMHWEYFNETLRPQNRNLIGLVVAQVADPTEGANLARTIDMRFDTESAQTFSQEDKALNAAIVGRFGAILSAMNLVSGLVLGVIVLIIGNTIAMSTRERTREYGTLRAIGFRPVHVVGFVLGEAAALGLVGGVLSLALAYPVLHGPLGRYLEDEMNIAPLYVTTWDLATILIVSAHLGLVAAALPALRAARLEVTQALANVA